MRWRRVSRRRGENGFSSWGSAPKRRWHLSWAFWDELYLAEGRPGGEHTRDAFASDRSAGHEAAPVRQRIGLAGNQLRNLNSLPTPPILSIPLAPVTGKGKKWIVGQWITPTSLTRQDINPDLRHLWACGRAGTSMPRSGSWVQVAISALSLVPMGRQQFYGSGIKPTIRRKSKKRAARIMTQQQKIINL